MLKLELSAREKNLLVILFGLVLPAVLYVLVISPKWDEVQIKKQELASAQAQLQELEQLSASDTLSKDVANLKGQITALQTGLPKEPATADFVQHLWQVSNQTGTELQDVDFAIATEGENLGIKNLGAVTAQVKVEGTYAQIRKFMDELETLPRINIINSFDIKEDKGLVGIIQLTGYSYPLTIPDIHVKSVIPPTDKVGKTSPF